MSFETEDLDEQDDSEIDDFLIVRRKYSRLKVELDWNQCFDVTDSGNVADIVTMSIVSNLR